MFGSILRKSRRGETSGAVAQRVSPMAILMANRWPFDRPERGDDAL